MKYQQPYGVSDPDAPYINGNPSTGTMGSIPPAASIEHPQREIVAAIESAIAQDLSGPQFPPTDADLEQLARAIQSSLLNTARDTGTANAYACNLAPAPTTYYEGMEVTLKIANANTGPSVFNVNNLGNKPIVSPADFSPLVAGVLRPGTYVKLKYDGENWQMVWSSSGGGVTGQPVYLTAPRTFYVNVNTGNDSWDGTAAVFSVGVAGPFKTLQRAADEVTKYNLNGYSITINVADGTYTSVNFRNFSGSGYVYWHGNSANPAAVNVVAATDNCAFTIWNCGQHMIDGFKVSAPGGGAKLNVASGLYLGGDATINLANIEYGAVAGAHLAVTRGAYCSISGSSFKISGGTGVGNGGQNHPPAHLLAYFSGNVEAGPPTPATMTITAAVNVGTFVYANTLAMVSYGHTFVNAGNVSGYKYKGETNAIINSLGGGVSYFPGSAAGSLTTGAQYT